VASLLIIDADRQATSELRQQLRAAGHSTAAASSGLDALERLLSSSPDLVLLELDLPDLDGLDFLEQLRGQGATVPVIVLSSRSDPADRVASLTGGADDFLAKPCHVPELLARIELRLRPAPSPASPVPQPVLEHDGLTLDTIQRVATVDGRRVRLSEREFLLAAEFVRNAGKAMTREQLLHAAWGLGFVTDSNIVDVYVRYLRGKLGRKRFETLRGVGYRMP
jgi:two component transcriptional regulator, winged helix family protein